MGWVQNAFSMVRQTGKKIAYPIASIWIDKIIDFIDLETKHMYGKVSFQLRRENDVGNKYLMVEYRGTEGSIWIPLTNADAIEIKSFLEQNFSR